MLHTFVVFLSAFASWQWLYRWGCYYCLYFCCCCLFYFPFFVTFVVIHSVAIVTPSENLQIYECPLLALTLLLFLTHQQTRPEQICVSVLCWPMFLLLAGRRICSTATLLFILFWIHFNALQPAIQLASVRYELKIFLFVLFLLIENPFI